MTMDLCGTACVYPDDAVISSCSRCGGMLNRLKPHVTYTLLLANIDEKPWLVAMDVVEAELFAQLCPECESPLVSLEAYHVAPVNGEPVDTPEIIDFRGVQRNRSMSI